MQAVGIYNLAGHLWEGRVPYYQAQVESGLIRRYAIMQGWEYEDACIQGKGSNNNAPFNLLKPSERTFPQSW